jgi:4-carboxymuconolactone decarboxylase
MHLATNESEIRGSVESHECTLRKLAIGDDAFIDGVLANERTNLALSGLDPKSHALVRLGALIAVDAAAPSYLDALESARACDTSDEELVGCLIAVLPELGAARVISVAPKLGLAIGYDVAAALEDLGSPLA